MSIEDIEEIDDDEDVETTNENASNDRIRNILHLLRYPREIDEYVALGMKPLEMTMGKRLDGSSGMMTIEERYDINAKKAETIASEIKELRKQMGISSTDEESDFGRCRDYASYVEYKQKENVQREKDGLETEKLLVLNGIAREVGMSYDAMMTMYNKKRTFSAALNGVYEGRKMLMRAMRKTGSSIPMHDYQQIQQLRAIAMNPNLP